MPAVQSELEDTLGSMVGWADKPLGTTLDFPPHGDARGDLVAIEDFDVGFDIKRVYYLIGTQGDATRGFHAHLQLQQIVVAVAGSCEFVLDDGKTRRSVSLDRPTKGLFVGPRIWREMHSFSQDCVLLVIASQNYDEKDYIRDYDQFLKLVT
jgi:dTDP-4-dehydrorhamnose 3,5-epimerase-like enzyme